jgi:HMG (high mobility group) box
MQNQAGNGDSDDAQIHLSESVQDAFQENQAISIHFPGTKVLNNSALPIKNFPSSLRKKYSRNPFKWVRQKSADDAPKRPLSSYNMFFLLERDRIINGGVERIFGLEDAKNIVEMQKMKDMHHKRSHRKSHGIISFHDLSRTVAKKWKTLDSSTKAIFDEQAAVEKVAYKKAMDDWVRMKMRGFHGLAPHTSEQPNNSEQLHSMSNGDVKHAEMNESKAFVKNVERMYTGPSLHKFPRTKSSEATGREPSINEIHVEDFPFQSVEDATYPKTSLNHAELPANNMEWKIGDGPLWYEAGKFSEELSLASFERLSIKEVSSHNSSKDADRSCLNCGQPISIYEFYCGDCSLVYIQAADRSQPVQVDMPLTAQMYQSESIHRRPSIKLPLIPETSKLEHPFGQEYTNDSSGSLYESSSSMGLSNHQLTMNGGEIWENELQNNSILSTICLDSTAQHGKHDDGLEAAYDDEYQSMWE